MQNPPFQFLSVVPEHPGEVVRWEELVLPRGTGEEKAILARYSGWDAMANVFEAHPPRAWEKTAGELRQLLTADEYASARIFRNGRCGLVTSRM